MSECICTHSYQSCKGCRKYKMTDEHKHMNKEQDQYEGFDKTAPRRTAQINPSEFDYNPCSEVGLGHYIADYFPYTSFFNDYPKHPIMNIYTSAYPFKPKKTDAEKFEEYVNNTLDSIANTVKTKATDYGDPEDVAKNFKFAADAVGIDVRKGVMLRVMDKVSRIMNHIERNDLEGESVEDSIADIIGYMLQLGYIESQSDEEV